MRPAAKVTIGIVLLFGPATGCRRAAPAVGKTPIPLASASHASVGADIAECVDTNVAAGFIGEDDIVDLCVDAAEADAAVDRQAVAALVATAMAKHKSRELGWRTATDCDRLDAAFAALEREGIVARQNFADCQTCGVAEMEEETDALVKAGKPVKGYTFYHQQDTEAAVEGRGIFLTYGALVDNEAADVEIGRRVVRVMTDFGLHTSWNGSVKTRIAVGPMQWERRRFTPAPEVRRSVHQTAARHR